MRCDCGHDNAAGTRYCLSCGATLPSAPRGAGIDATHVSEPSGADEQPRVQDADLAAESVRPSPDALPRRSWMRLVAGLLLALVAITGVAAAGLHYRSARRAERAERLAVERRARLAETRAAQTAAIAAQKDTLLSELMASAAFMNQISDELSKVATLRRGTLVRYQERLVPVAEYRAGVLARIKELGAHVDSSDARLRMIEARLRGLGAAGGEMTARIADFERLVTQYKAAIQDQRAQIERLTSQVGTLQADNARLVREKTQLTAQYMTLAETANTVYWIAGTKAQLLELGVITEEGGRKAFLVVGRRTGSTVVPARDVHEADFTPISKTADVDIVLPKPDRVYEIVSRHNPAYVEPMSNGTVRGRVHVVDPQQFWAPSKFLIFMEK